MSRPTISVAASLAAGLLASCTLASCVAVEGRAPKAAPAALNYRDEEAGIRQSLTTYAAARQRGDGPAQAALYTEDAEFWNPMSEDGLVRTRATMATFLAGEPEPFRLEAVNISFASPEVALVDAHFFGSAPQPNGVAYYVMARRGGQWLIRAVRIMPLREPKPG